MNLKKSITSAALTLFVATAPAALAKDHPKAKQKKQKQNVAQSAQFNEGFQHFDSNGDGVISRNEFPGDRTLFDRLDSNRNGTVSRTEAQAYLGSDDARRLADQYRDLDRNRDGQISRAEWRGDLATFDRLDRNDDGVLSNADRRNSGSTTNAPGRYNGLDKNGDGVVSRTEWRGNDTSFRNQDRNRDGILSGTELRRQ
ncbi:MAG TPA: EF-hand domain-containing protein [Thermoanaerobaculia bacterium]|jgi:hypothetical protein